MTPDLEGAKVFRAMFFCACIGGAMLAVIVGGIGSLLGAW